MIVLTEEEAVVAANLKQVAEERGLSLRQLAGLAKVPFKTVHNVLSGARSPRYSTISRLAKALKVPLEDLEKAHPPRRRRAAV